MRGIIVVTNDLLDDTALARWISQALGYVSRPAAEIAREPAVLGAAAQTILRPRAACDSLLPPLMPACLSRGGGDCES